MFCFYNNNCSRGREFWGLEYGIDNSSDNASSCSSNSSTVTTPTCSQEAKDDMTVRNPKLMLQDGSGENIAYIQYDQLTYFEDLKAGNDDRQSIWDAMATRIAETLKDFAMHWITFGSAASCNQRIHIGYAGFCRRRYAVHVVVPQGNFFKSEVVLSPVEQPPIHEHLY